MALLPNGAVALIQIRRAADFAVLFAARFGDVLECELDGGPRTRFMTTPDGFRELSGRVASSFQRAAGEVERKAGERADAVKSAIERGSRDRVLR